MLDVGVLELPMEEQLMCSQGQLHGLGGLGSCSLQESKRRAAVTIEENIASLLCFFAFILYLCTFSCVPVRSVISSNFFFNC